MSDGDSDRMLAFDQQKKIVVRNNVNQSKDLSAPAPDVPLTLYASRSL
jgi:hypothetical protein